MDGPGLAIRAIPFAICDTACWNVLGICIPIIRKANGMPYVTVCALSRNDCITRSNATVVDGPSHGGLYIFHDQMREWVQCGGHIKSKRNH